MFYLLIPLCVVAISLTAPPLNAKPLITSSEDTAARLCLADEAEDAELIRLCEAALAEGGQTAAERSEILAILGDAHLGVGQDPQAEPIFREALVQDPTNTDALNGLGWIYWDLDREVEAEAYFRRSVELRPTAEGLGGLGSSLWRSGLAPVEEAEGYLLAALAISPEYRWAMRDLGWMEHGRGNDEAAVAWFDQAIGLEDFDRNALHGRSLALGDLGEYEAALIAANRVIEIYAGDSWAFAQRAFILRRLNRNAQALKDAEQAIDLNPDASDGYLQSALALRDLGRTADALSAFARARARDIRSSLLDYWHADVLSDAGRMTEARKAVERAIWLDGDNSSYHILRAWILLREEAWPQARAAAERALALDSTLTYPHYYVAVTLANTADPDAAIARFDRAVEAGIGESMIGTFAADLVAAGHILSALKLRQRY